MKAAYATILALVLALGLPAKSYAAAAPVITTPTVPRGAITISPFLVETQLRPEDTSKNFQISLTNNTGKQQDFSISAVDVGSLNDTGGLAFVGSSIKNFSVKYGLAKWLHLPSGTLALAAGESTTITASVSNDAALGPGGHYAAIIMSVNSPSGKTTDGLQIQQKISALVFATKVGGEVYDMKLESIRHDGNWRHLPRIYILNFQNKGNVHIVPRGTLQLLGPDGVVVAQGTVNEASAYVLPETSRQVVVQTHELTGAGWRPGRYTIRVDYRYDGHPAFASRALTFDYRNIPGMSLMILALLVVVTITTLVLLRYRRAGAAKPRK